MFCNLHFLKTFRDHNFSDFWVGSTTGAQIDKVPETILAGYVRNSFLPVPNGGDLPPDFDPILILTLSPKCCASFIRTYPEWPYDERDYYLSKLYQFLLVILEEKYDFFNVSGSNRLGMLVEDLLNLIPRGILPPNADVDWYQFWWQIWKASSTSTLDEVLGLLQDSVADILGMTEAQIEKALDDGGRPSRRYGPEPDSETHRRVFEIVSKYPNWKGSEELKQICREMTEAGIPVPPPWKNRQPPLLDWNAGLVADKEATVKNIEYRFKRGALVR